MKALARKLMVKSGKKQKGMTLVELLAVIVILGLIAAIGTIAIGNIINKSRDDAEDRKVEMIEQAATMYYLDNPDAVTTDDTDITTPLADYYDGDLSGYTVTMDINGDVEVTAAP